MAYSDVDIRRVAECFATDLAMLVNKIGADDKDWAKKMESDVVLMAMHKCLAHIHVQLRDENENIMVAHRYDVPGSLACSRSDNWLHSSLEKLRVIVLCSDEQKREKLRQNGSFYIPWMSAEPPIDYSQMLEGDNRCYRSNNYRWDRTSYYLQYDGSRPLRGVRSVSPA